MHVSCEMTLLTVVDGQIFIVPHTFRLPGKGFGASLRRISIRSDLWAHLHLAAPLWCLASQVRPNQPIGMRQPELQLETAIATYPHARWVIKTQDHVVN